jgi:hypothetical protein
MNGRDIAQTVWRWQAASRHAGRSRVGGNPPSRSYVGALVITPQRVLGALSTVPKLAGRAIDQRWDAPREGAVKVELSPDGLALDVDTSQIDPAFSGQLSLQYKAAIPEALLASIPHRSLAFDVPREWVLRAVGVPAPRRA